MKTTIISQIKVIEQIDSTSEQITLDAFTVSSHPTNSHSGPFVLSLHLWHLLKNVLAGCLISWPKKHVKLILICILFQKTKNWCWITMRGQWAASLTHVPEQCNYLTLTPFILETSFAMPISHKVQEHIYERF